MTAANSPINGSLHYLVHMYMVYQYSLLPPTLSIAQAATAAPSIIFTPEHLPLRRVDSLQHDMHILGQHVLTDGVPWLPWTPLVTVALTNGVTLFSCKGMKPCKKVSIHKHLCALIASTAIDKKCTWEDLRARAPVIGLGTFLGTGNTIPPKPHIAQYIIVLLAHSMRLYQPPTLLPVLGMKVRTPQQHIPVSFCC